MPDSAPSQLVLASQSPRRAQMLAAAGYRFVQRDPGWQDPARPQVRASAMQAAEEIARRKAEASPPQHPGELVLTADTLVEMPDGSLAGTPEGEVAARRMLERLVDATHGVVTAVALRNDGEMEVIVDRAEVRLGPVSEADREAYLATDRWKGKAGGYHHAERTAAGWPIEILGEPTTVAGLPMPMLARRLAEKGITPE
ncbi:MAG: Maf family protein [Phycisphaeraceae bacterium]|nr:Maf family protein [Phycisphaeraceae bacterium]